MKHEHAEPLPARFVRRVEITPKTIAAILVAAALVWLFLHLWHIVVLVVVSLVLVGTLRPLVRWLETVGFGKTLAVVSVFAALLIATSLLLLISVPPLLDQLVVLAKEAPQTRLTLIAWLKESTVLAPLARVVGGASSDSLLAKAGDAVIGYFPRVAEMLGYGLSAIFLAFYLLVDDRRAQGALFAVTPRDYHLPLARIMLNLETIVGGYVRGQLITSGAIALFTFALLTICQIPNALSIAVFAGLTDVLPFVGGLLAATPAVLAAIPLGGSTVLVVACAMFAYQELESRVLVPRLYGHVLRLSPASVLLALLVGGSLLGIVGALLALPIAAGLQMIARELRVDMPGDATDASALRERDELAAKEYEHLSAGTAPQEAAQIATGMAHDILQADADDPAEAAQVPITAGISG